MWITGFVWFNQREKNIIKILNSKFSGFFQTPKNKIEVFKQKDHIYNEKKKRKKRKKIQYKKNTI